jgi:hypothetical protein
MDRVRSSAAIETYADSGEITSGQQPPKGSGGYSRCGW